MTAALEAVETAAANIGMVVEQHGDIRVGDVDTAVYSLEIALDYLREAEEALACGCRDGILWPIATDRDRSHDWVERCDECASFDSDDEAAKALGETLACRVAWRWHPSLNRLAPCIDLPHGEEA